MTITLESIKADFNRLTEALAKLEAQSIATSPFPMTLDLPTLNDGERYVGAIISADGTKKHHIILLPGSVENKNWQDAMEWAASIGGELPDRSEGALLFATMKDEFEETWYWTREQHAAYSDYAWYQYFDYGYQGSSSKSYQGRARAVHRLVIQ